MDAGPPSDAGEQDRQAHQIPAHMLMASHVGPFGFMPMPAGFPPHLSLHPEVGGLGRAMLQLDQPMLHWAAAAAAAAAAAQPPPPMQAPQMVAPQSAQQMMPSQHQGRPPAMHGVKRPVPPRAMPRPMPSVSLAGGQTKSFAPVLGRGIPGLTDEAFEHAAAATAAVADDEVVNKFFADGCRCGLSCARELDKEDVIRRRSWALSMPDDLRDMFVLGQLTVSQMPPANIGTTRQRERYELRFDAKRPVCRDTFMLCNAIGIKRYRRLLGILKQTAPIRAGVPSSSSSGGAAGGSGSAAVAAPGSTGAAAGAAGGFAQVGDRDDEPGDRPAKRFHSAMGYGNLLPATAELTVMDPSASESTLSRNDADASPDGQDHMFFAHQP